MYCSHTPVPLMRFGTALLCTDLRTHTFRSEYLVAEMRCVCNFVHSRQLFHVRRPRNFPDLQSNWLRFIDASRTPAPHLRRHQSPQYPLRRHFQHALRLLPDSSSIWLRLHCTLTGQVSSGGSFALLCASLIRDGQGLTPRTSYARAASETFRCFGPNFSCAPL